MSVEGYPTAGTGEGKVSAHKQAGLRRVLVLRGGPSAERAVSLVSGKAVAKALREMGFEVQEADIGPGDLSALEGRFDVVFPVLHGRFGEDGQLQAILEERGLTYVGSDAASSRLAMDKWAAKEAFRAAGLQTAPAQLIRGQGGDEDGDLVRAVETMGLPIVVKPNFEGSSIGVVIARTAEEARTAVKTCLSLHGDCLVEQFVAGRELTVGVLAGETLPVLEVRTAGGFYDYAAKYEADTTQYLFDVDLPAEVVAEAAEAGRRAFEALGCRDFGRVDVIADRAGRSWVLEVNTIPGFTDHSLLPKAAARAGKGFGQMCAQIVRLAWARTI